MLTPAMVCSGLHFVCATGNLPCAQLFIKAGADLDLGDKEGMHTRLHMHGDTPEEMLTLPLHMLVLHLSPDSHLHLHIWGILVVRNRIIALLLTQHEGKLSSL